MLRSQGGGAYQPGIAKKPNEQVIVNSNLLIETLKDTGPYIANLLLHHPSE